jgi:transposase
MIWRPRFLTRTQREARRLAAGRLLQADQLSQAEIARRMGVSRMAVSQWAKHLRQHRGDTASWHTRPRPGCPARLSAEPWQRVLMVLTAGARRAGFDTERWTLCRIRAFIKTVEGPHMR